MLVRLAEREDANTEAILAAASSPYFNSEYVDVLCGLARGRARTDAARIAAAIERARESSGFGYARSAHMVLVELAHHGAPTDTILSSIATVDSARTGKWEWTDNGWRSEVLQALVRPARLAVLPEPEADRIAAAARDCDRPVLVALIGRASRAALEKAAGALDPSERKAVLDALAERSPR